jgi:hypothetical protein
MGEFMSVNTARGIAWSLVGVYIILGAAGMTLQAITGKPYVEEIGIPGLILRLILVGLWPVTGALFLYLPVQALEPIPADLFFSPLTHNPLGASPSIWTYLAPLKWLTLIILVLCYAAALLSLISRAHRARGDERQQTLAAFSARMREKWNWKGFLKRCWQWWMRLCSWRTFHCG